MKKMRKRIALFFALSLCVSVRPVLAKRMVSDFSEFKQLCESDTKETIELNSDIMAEDIIWFGVLCMGKFMVDVCF